MSDEFDLGALLGRAQAMQQQMLEAQANAAQQIVEGQAGGGVVKVRMTGAMEFQSVFIDPRAVDPDDVSILEDLVLAACNDAVSEAQALAAEAMGDLDLSGLAGPGAAPAPGLDTGPSAGPSTGPSTGTGELPLADS